MCVRQSGIDHALICLTLFCHNLRVPYTIYPAHVRQSWLRYIYTHRQILKLQKHSPYSAHRVVVCLETFLPHTYSHSSHAFLTSQLCLRPQRWFCLKECSCSLVLHLFGANTAVSKAQCTYSVCYTTNGNTCTHLTEHNGLVSNETYNS